MKYNSIIHMNEMWLKFARPTFWRAFADDILHLAGIGLLSAQGRELVVEG